MVVRMGAFSGDLAGSVVTERARSTLLYSSLLLRKVVVMHITAFLLLNRAGLEYRFHDTIQFNTSVWFNFI